MKKIFLLSSAAIIFAIAAQAQFKVGVKLSSALSNQSRNDVRTGKLFSDNSFKGYDMGLVGDLQLSSHIYLQPQLLYSKKGSRYTGVFGTDARLTMHSIEVPLNVLYKVEMPFGKIFAGAGPVVSYGFAGKLENNGQTKHLYSGDMKNWSRVDISANAVTGIEFNNGFFAGIAYQRGFKDLNKTDAVTAKNRSLSLSVGYMINWKKTRS